MGKKRDQIRLTDDELREFLAKTKTIILTSIGPDGFPHSMPMWFAAEPDGTIRITTFAKSQKVLNIRRNPKVSLLVETGTAYSALRGVMLEGDAEITTDLEETVATMIEANAVTGSPLPDIEQIPQDVKLKMAGKRVLVRIRPSRFVSWDHGKLPSSKTPDGLRKAIG
jgi:PPOX class probable F420-dependent enzyme